MLLVLKHDAYEGLIEVVTRDVARLSIEWPAADKQEIRAKPQHRGLPFLKGY